MITLLAVMEGLLCQPDAEAAKRNFSKQQQMLFFWVAPKRPSSQGNIAKHQLPRVKLFSTGYQRMSRALFARVRRHGYQGAAEQLIDAVIRGGLTTAVQDRRIGADVGGLPYDLYLDVASRGTYPDIFGTGSKKVTPPYPELAGLLESSDDQTLRGQWLDRARRIQTIVENIDAPLYAAAEKPFLQDVRGARVLMIGRATEGFFHWITAGMRGRGQAGQSRTRDIDQIDISGLSIHPAIDSRCYDLSRSRPSFYAQLAQVLKDAGYDAKDLLASGRRLVLLDTGRYGTIPRQVKIALMRSIAQSGDLAAMQRLDQLIEVRLLWSEAKDGNVNNLGQRFQEQQPAIDCRNFAAVIETRTAQGYIDVSKGRNLSAMYMIDERPHVRERTVGIKRNRAGRWHMTPETVEKMDYVDYSNPKQQARLRLLDALLFDMALIAKRTSSLGRMPRRLRQYWKPR